MNNYYLSSQQNQHTQQYRPKKIPQKLNCFASYFISVEDQRVKLNYTTAHVTKCQQIKQLTIVTTHYFNLYTVSND